LVFDAVEVVAADAELVLLGRDVAQLELGPGADFINPIRP
jgi:hypothetical protein